MKIFCVGRNYAAHARELNNEVPDKPVIFMKPATALLRNGQAFYYPAFSRDIHYEGEIVLRIGKNGKSIHECLGTTEYPRLRFGIGNDFEKSKQVAYVLGKWKLDEIETVKQKIKVSGEIIENFVSIGIDRTMNLYNQMKF